MVEKNTQRGHGETGAVAEAKSAAETMLDQNVLELPEERATKWRTPGMIRMRFTWASTEERVVIDRAKNEANRVTQIVFADAYAIMNRVYDIVRESELDANGTPKRDEHGFLVWRRRPDGWYDEDFTRLTRKQREDFLFSITTALFGWEQRAADLWADAMFSKAQFEERFAIAYDAPMKGTVDDRNAKANMEAADERYFAIFESVLSRKADAIVRSMERLSQRLKDVMQS